MIEIWKDINDFIGLYQVSNCGRIKSFKRGKEKIMKPRKDKDGYLLVNLWKDGKRITKRVHRLVAEAFLDNPNNLPCINHKDCNPQNNHVENIEYCDAKYNCNYGSHNELLSKAQINNSKKSKTVLQFNFDGTFIKEFPSAHEVKRQLGFDDSSICKCCKNIIKQSYGYIWRYKNEE